MNNQVTSLCFFAAQGHCAAKQGSTTGCLDLPRWLRPHLPPLHANLKGPLQPHKATMCGPAFARSWEDDEEQQWQLSNYCSEGISISLRGATATWQYLYALLPDAGDCHAIARKDMVEK